MKVIDYLKVTIEDLDVVEQLYREYLDNGTQLRERIDEIFIERGTISCKAVDHDTGEIAGLIVYTMGVAFSCDFDDIINEVNELVGDAMIYTGESFLVTYKYRGQNISEKMMYKMKEFLEEEKASTGKDIFVLHEMWVYPDGKTPAYRSVNDIYGITYDLGIKKHFYKDYYKKGHLCPVCGKNCVCSARITLSRI